MKRFLILGVVALMVAVTYATVSFNGEKTIDTNEFSFGTEASFQNKTSEERQ